MYQHTKSFSPAPGRARAKPNSGDGVADQEPCARAYCRQTAVLEEDCVAAPERGGAVDSGCRAQAPRRQINLRSICNGSRRQSLSENWKGNAMAKTLEGKVALVTGGSRGIGAAIAKRLAGEGAAVAITYTKGADGAAAVVEAIKSAGGKAIAVQADATAPDRVAAAVGKTVATLGKLDVFVNNAGTAIPKKFEETTLEELDRVIDLNLRGAFVATQAALKRMNDGGRIILIGSCVGERMMTPGLVPYAATKGAIKMFAQGLSREVGSRGITVNNIQPGPIDTDLN